MTSTPTSEKVLLHVCCAPCACHAVEELRRNGYEVTLFFSNSNISPESEYRKRLGEAEKLAAGCSCTLVSDVYEHGAWLRFIQGLEQEPEKGRRCLKCFEFNLRRAADFARTGGFAKFTTTLTISPHKSSADIFRIGLRLGDFLPIDFKKADGFRRGVELSRKHGFYRQRYCGCEFSVRS